MNPAISVANLPAAGATPLALMESSTAFDAQAKGLGEYLRSRPWPATV